jgi:hypothetical protein
MPRRTAFFNPPGEKYGLGAFLIPPALPVVADSRPKPVADKPLNPRTGRYGTLKNSAAILK